MPDVHEDQGHAEPHPPASDPPAGAAAVRASVRVGIYPSATAACRERAEWRARGMQELADALVRRDTPEWVNVVAAVVEAVGALEPYELERVLRRVRKELGPPPNPPTG